jgi:hypothetical protein
MLETDRPTWKNLGIREICYCFESWLKCSCLICGFITIEFDIDHNSVMNRMTSLVLMALFILWTTLPVSCPAEWNANCENVKSLPTRVECWQRGEEMVWDALTCCNFVRRSAVPQNAQKRVYLRSVHRLFVFCARFCSTSDSAKFKVLLPFSYTFLQPLTRRSSVLLEEVTGSKLVKKFP